MVQKRLLLALIALATCGLLGVPAIAPQACEDAAQFLQRTTGIEVSCCPHCRLGRWRTVQLLPPLRAGSTPPTSACRGPP